MRWIFCLPLLLAACSAPSEGNGASPVAEPAYGPVMDYRGILTTGFEISALTHCGSDDLESCRGADCWFRSTEEFSRRLGSTFPEWDGEGGVYFIRFRGRRAEGGAFGHMDSYFCQVEGVALLSAQAGLP